MLNKAFKGFLILWAVSTAIALIVRLTGEPSASVPPASDAQNTREIEVQPKRNPPDSFRGIKWGSALPSALKLRETALKGCTAIIEQKDFTSRQLCSHMHIDTDDMDLFGLRQNVPPIFGVPVSEQMLDWSHRKFWSAEVFIHNYREADLAKLRAALIDHYGPPTFKNEQCI
ncbi:MAG: hypothetical protein ACREDT_11980 [Methylocella sp.]